MIYKFKSKAAGDVIMLAASGDHVLRILGREPAAKGILEVAAMPAAMAAIEAAVQQDDEARQQAATDGKRAQAGEAITLRQRAWPLLEMIKRSQAAGADIVWGV